MNNLTQTFIVLLGTVFFIAHMAILIIGIISVFDAEYNKATALFTMLILVKVMQLKS